MRERILKKNTFFISTTDINAFETLRKKLISENVITGKELIDLEFNKVKYTYSELIKAKNILFENREQYKIIGAGTNIETNSVFLDFTSNPSLKQLEEMKKLSNYNNIEINIIKNTSIDSDDSIIIKSEIKYKNGKEYTGWATSKSTGNRFYYKDGIRVTGVNVINGSRCVFDDKGKWLFNRTNSKEKYSVIFDNDYNINIKDGKIMFKIKINERQSKTRFDFDANPHFSLYVYKDGQWKSVKYKDTGFDAYAVIADENMEISFSKNLSDFNFKFKPGIYRVKVAVGNSDRNDNGELIRVDVRGEFNLK